MIVQPARPSGDSNLSIPTAPDDRHLRPPCSDLRLHPALRTLRLNQSAAEDVIHTILLLTSARLRSCTTYLTPVHGACGRKIAEGFHGASGAGLGLLWRISAPETAGRMFPTTSPGWCGTRLLVGSPQRIRFRDAHFSPSSTGAGCAICRMENVDQSCFGRDETQRRCR